MEKDGRIYIAPSFTKEDYLNIRLSAMESSEQDWERAIEIFINRVYGRFFEPIRFLTERGVNENGFAIMALDCLLVETLYQFHNGLNKTSGGNKAKYSSFLRQAMPDIFTSQEIAEIFYSNIRCGILHSAQTKNGSRLTFGKHEIISEFRSGKIQVDVEGFTNRLRDCFDAYINAISCKDNRELRENFIEKMNYICLMDEEWI